MTNRSRKQAGVVGIRGLRKSYGSVTVFDDFNLTVPAGRVTVLLGPSGCGKTTLLKCLAGLEDLDAGSFPGFSDMRFSMVFQEPRLLPWATVRENIELVRAAGETPDGTAHSRGPGGRRDDMSTAALLEAVELQGSEEAYPGELSGGMAQRVALARAFAVSAQALLLDEPFRALDIALRVRMYDLFRRLWRKERPTTIFVTHNVEEAVLQGDQLVMLSRKPAQTVAQLENPLPYTERHLDQPAVRDLQTEVYRLLFEAAAGS
jgi:ABC-type nitrate/sulfonate/bicarbonate transport system ATPase subunit